MMNKNHACWYFTEEQLNSSPSRKNGYDCHKELSCRQEAANFIFDVGVKLKLSYECINAATMYMHRFYVFHSLAIFQRHGLASAAVFLAAKVSEQPRKLESVIKAYRILLYKDYNPIDTTSQHYLQEVHDLLLNESMIIQTLSFNLTIALPHTDIVKIWHNLKSTRVMEDTDQDVFEAAYSLAHCCIHLTLLCLKHRPNTIATLCIYLACKWYDYEIAKKDWFSSIDKEITLSRLENLSDEFVTVINKCPEERRSRVLSLNRKLLKRNNLENNNKQTNSLESIILSKDRKDVKTKLNSKNESWSESKSKSKLIINSVKSVDSPKTNISALNLRDKTDLNLYNCKAQEKLTPSIKPNSIIEECTIMGKNPFISDDNPLYHTNNNMYIDEGLQTSKENASLTTGLSNEFTQTCALGIIDETNDFLVVDSEIEVPYNEPLLNKNSQSKKSEIEKLKRTQLKVVIPKDKLHISSIVTGLTRKSEHDFNHEIKRQKLEEIEI